MPTSETVSRHIRIDSVEPLMDGVPLHDVVLLIASPLSKIHALTPRDWSKEGLLRGQGATEVGNDFVGDSTLREKSSHLKNLVCPACLAYKGLSDGCVLLTFDLRRSITHLALLWGLTTHELIKLFRLDGCKQGRGPLRVSLSTTIMPQRTELLQHLYSLPPRVTDS